MTRIHAFVPAAGCGARFGAEIPKQYLPIGGRPMLHRTLSVLCECTLVERVWVVLSPGDAWWTDDKPQESACRLEVLRCGGETRAETVLHGLQAAAGSIADDDWVMVHDAARPCLSQTLLSELIGALRDDPVGGLLAVPVADTLKRADAAGRVAETVPREGLWHAQTPQMFRFGLLLQALQRCPSVTDEASAVEAAGHRPRLVRSDPGNFKVTVPGDLWLAERVLAARDR